VVNGLTASTDTSTYQQPPATTHSRPKRLFRAKQTNTAAGQIEENPRQQEVVNNKPTDNRTRPAPNPVRKTPTLRRVGGRPEIGKTQNRHQPPIGLDAPPPHDPCGPENDGNPKDDGERLGKREEAWTAGGKG
jgi:hypothetical protein